jgi:hypothetical protein
LGVFKLMNNQCDMADIAGPVGIVALSTVTSTDATSGAHAPGMTPRWGEFPHRQDARGRYGCSRGCAAGGRGGGGGRGVACDGASRVQRFRSGDALEVIHGILVELGVGKPVFFLEKAELLFCGTTA